MISSALIALAMLASTTITSAAAQPSCAFGLGFAALHDLVPELVGECVDDEFDDPLTGDARQDTTNGLLAWRKSDNWTAFTDGNQSWVHGPLGLQQRQNDQRLWWEANPDVLPILPTPRPNERCHTAGLALSIGRVDAGAGNLVGTFRFTNTLEVECRMVGYPGAQLLGEAADPVPTTVVRGGGYFSDDPPPRAVDIQPHAAALFRVHWEQVPVGNETTCSVASQIAVTPPDEYVAVSAPIQIRACGGGHLDITAVQADTPD